MKKRGLWIIFTILSLPIVLAFLLAMWIFQRCPYIAPAAGGILLCVGIAALAKSRLPLLIAPRRVAEKRVERFIKAGKTVYFVHFAPFEDMDIDIDEEECGPDMLFSGVLREHDGLRSLVFSGVVPQKTAAWIIANRGAEMTAVFAEGGKGIWLTGTLEGPCSVDRNICSFQFNVHTAKLSGCSRVLSI